MQTVITVVGWARRRPGKDSVWRVALMAGSSGPVVQILPKASCMLDELKESKTPLSTSFPAKAAKLWKKPLRTGQ
ncbi:hypothetical protein GCM10007893_28460 [Paracoccus marinus]|nr:hypothetical protein GCM10007893_28460 [Paracoccus marinus]